jgi:tripartite-type tricarboxylate transporter receptor subunit TctC
MVAYGPLARKFVLFGAALVLGLASVASPAKAEYPERTITIVVPFAPGGASDYMARLLSTHLRDRLKQTVIVENKPGAGGNIGIGHAARAKPDGYTFLISSSVFVVNPSLYRHAPYDPLKSFAPVTELIASPNVIAVRADAGIKDLNDLIAKANANPGKYNYSTPGTGTSTNLMMELLKSKKKFDIVHIPYPGAAPAVQALLAGQVQATAMTLSVVLPFVKAGTLKVLVVTGDKRWPDLPDVPTIAEAGFADSVNQTFQALFAPAGTPQPIIDRIAKETVAIFNAPALEKSLREAGYGVTAAGPKALGDLVAHEVPMWRGMIKTAGIPLN